MLAKKASFALCHGAIATANVRMYARIHNLQPRGRLLT